ncbi:carbonate dehydratase [Angomonas deanei]|uniref:Carbonic anhydrase n=1 Tax=Angomonas deanei TaxID=59799 RepID=A0A7G2CBC5_9TRYP|nr:carbonate dehydratase [Angomonas deanei]CAD2216244.1 Carbonic anhydrase, putative [Angomonas deanei]|eukprot:EPY40176.1 carbonate dehydratase [Angomonas deanei]
MPFALLNVKTEHNIEATHHGTPEEDAPPPKHPSFAELMENNRKWADSQPTKFFRRLKVQQPDFLWIGCSDSRIPTNQITGTEAGQIFVHRNVGNLVLNTDFNLLCVLQYAVNILKVKHVIVCGHYGCGGIHAALSSCDHQHILNGWLKQIKSIYFYHKEELEALENDKQREHRLTELSVIQQVKNLSYSSTIQRAWQSTNQVRPHLHGLVYSLSDGSLKELIHLAPDTVLDPIFQFHL